MTKTIQPNVWCAYDNCCYFAPGSTNGKYCVDHKCKRRAENAKKRLTAPLDNPTLLWAIEEDAKVAKAQLSQRKNEWLLDNSRIVFFDIESSNLDANIGMLLCACIKDLNGPIKTFTMSRKAGLLSDRETVVAIRDELENADYITTFYGTGFDIPFLNTRLIVQGERPLDHLRHIDMYYVARFKLKLHSNRLQVVSESLFGNSAKTPVSGPIWTKALMGDKASLEQIIAHCKVDVEELEKVFKTLRGFVNLSKTRQRVFGAGL